MNATRVPIPAVKAHACHRSGGEEVYDANNDCRHHPYHYHADG